MYITAQIITADNEARGEKKTQKEAYKLHTN